MEASLVSLKSKCPREKCGACDQKNPTRPVRQFATATGARKKERTVNQAACTHTHTHSHENED